MQMPIILTDINQNTQAVTYDPKYFSSDLTGSNKKLGVLSETFNLKSVDQDYFQFKKRRNYTNGNVSTKEIPLHPLHPEVRNQMSFTTFDKDLSRSVLIYETDEHQYHFDITLTQIELEKEERKNAAAKSNNKAGYRLSLWKTAKNYQGEKVVINSLATAMLNDVFTTSDNAVIITETYNVERYVHTLENIIGNISNDQYDKKAFNEYLSDFTAYDAVCHLSQLWQEKSIDILKTAIDLNKTDALFTNALAQQLYYMETYKLNLELYTELYHYIKNAYPEDVCKALFKHNLNLLLSETLNEINNKKDQLEPLPTPDTSLVPSYYTIQQKGAITSDDPLLLIQAVAGSGKSTTLLGRIDYLKQNGVPEEDITVLSFTNAAADNITSKNPNVHSFTIASMIHQIYSHNFTEHNLSTIDTLVNTLEIYYRGNSFIKEFSKLLWGAKNADNNAFAKLNNFIEENQEKVIEALDRVKQTTLELEIMLCYQLIDNLKEPEELASKHLIIDETQDNSIFEFIYTLKYVNKHNMTLFIVGDASQTLYEFRAANPRALNVIEMSNLFKIYRLETNYRSNQEILDFANMTLSSIETNKYANLKLQSNDLTPVTVDSFEEKVQISYKKMERVGEMQSQLGYWIADSRHYLNQNMKKKEQTAFLAHTRRDVMIIQKALEQLYPNAKITNLIPEKSFNSTIFSDFIRVYWEQLSLTPSVKILDTIKYNMLSHLSNLSSRPDADRPFVQAQLQNWVQENLAWVNTWFIQYNNRKITKQQFMENVKMSLLDYEINHNQIKQSLTAQRNKEKKEQDTSDSDFVLSTIHSAKGLEFDHTVVLYKDETTISEEKKRMYYVAFTRAMKSELILAYGTLANPKIVGNHEYIKTVLENQGHDEEIEEEAIN